MEKIQIITLLKRFQDDDRLDNRCWRSEMGEVELWENRSFLRALGTSGSQRATTLDMANQNPSRTANMAGGGSATTPTPGTSTITTTYSTPLIVCHHVYEGVVTSLPGHTID